MDIKDKRPSLFEKTTCNIWTDPYIQQQMLKEHLDPDSDGATRRQDSVSKIIDFILENTNPAGRLLDLGCGPGLYTSVFRDKNYTVTGIDFNKASIDYAVQNRGDIRYLMGDYIKEYPQGQYDAVIMIYCDMGTHSDKDRDVLLKNVYDSLDDSGVFIFDVFSEDFVIDKHETKDWQYASSGGFWSIEEYLLLSQTFHYTEDNAVASQYNLLTKNQNKHFIVWDRYYSEKEIKSCLKSIGFNDISIYKNLLNVNDFTSNSEMFVVARK